MNFTEQQNPRHRKNRSATPSSNPGNKSSETNEGPSYLEFVVNIARTASVTKGGRRFSFAAVVVVGDPSKGLVGIGHGKSNEVPGSIKKAVEDAKKSLVRIEKSNKTIPHEVRAKFDGAEIILKPASEGTGVIAAASARAVLDAAGISNILTKSLGSTNPSVLAKATLKALLMLRTKEQMRAIRFNA